MKKDFNLDDELKAAKVPERPKEYWEDFPRQTVVRLRRGTSQQQQEPRWFPRLAWGFAVAALCLFIGFAVGHRRGRTEMSAENLLQNGKLIQETLGMFPNRVRAIVQDEHGLNLVLSDQSDVPTSTPLYVSICDDKRCASFVTFSGQEITVAGKKMTVLSDAQGGVILAGDDFVWSSLERTYAKGGLRIQARRLTSVAL